LASSAVERGAEGVDGISLKAEPYVGVDGGGDADVGVAEEFLDDDEVDTLFLEQGRGRVSEVVEADATESGPVEEAAEAAGEAGRGDRSALRSDEEFRGCGGEPRPKVPGNVRRPLRPGFCPVGGTDEADGQMSRKISICAPTELSRSARSS
jgi:hypothetical protein